MPTPVSVAVHACSVTTGNVVSLLQECFDETVGHEVEHGVLIAVLSDARFDVREELRASTIAYLRDDKQRIIHLAAGEWGRIMSKALALVEAHYA